MISEHFWPSSGLSLKIFLIENLGLLPPLSIILEIRSEVKVTVIKKWHVTLHNLKIWTPNLEFVPQMILEICSGHDFSRNEVKGNATVT